MFQCSKNINMYLACVFDLKKKSLHLLQNIFFYLMRAKRLMREKELNTDMSHQVIPQCLKVLIYCTATGNIVCCLKKATDDFKRHYLKTIFSTTAFKQH